MFRSAARCEPSVLATLNAPGFYGGHVVTSAPGSPQSRSSVCGITQVCRFRSSLSVLFVSSYCSPVHFFRICIPCCWMSSLGYLAGRCPYPLAPFHFSVPCRGLPCVAARFPSRSLIQVSAKAQFSPTPSWELSAASYSWMCWHLSLPFVSGPLASF